MHWAWQVTIIARRPDDELLLLASDGLWDVLSNQEAVTLAKRCLRRVHQRGASRQSAARIAGGPLPSLCIGQQACCHCSINAACRMLSTDGVKTRRGWEDLPAVRRCSLHTSYCSQGGAQLL